MTQGQVRTILANAERRSSGGGDRGLERDRPVVRREDGAVACGGDGVLDLRAHGIGDLVAARGDRAVEVVIAGVLPADADDGVFDAMTKRRSAAIGRDRTNIVIDLDGLHFGRRCGVGDSGGAEHCGQADRSKKATHSNGIPFFKGQDGRTVPFLARQS